MSYNMAVICGLCILKRNGRQHGKLMQVQRPDGKTMEFTAPILVEELLQNFPGAGVGLSHNHLPLAYKLKLGNMYYLLPGARPEGESAVVNKAPSGTKRIKVVITKKQLRELVSNQTAVLAVQDLERQSDVNWRPELQSIPEEGESTNPNPCCHD